MNGWNQSLCRSVMRCYIVLLRRDCNKMIQQLEIVHGNLTLKCYTRPLCTQYVAVVFAFGVGYLVRIFYTFACCKIDRMVRIAFDNVDRLSLVIVVVLELAQCLYVLCLRCCCSCFAHADHN